MDSMNRFFHIYDKITSYFTNIAMKTVYTTKIHHFDFCDFILLYFQQTLERGQSNVHFSVNANSSYPEMFSGISVQPG